VQIQKGVIARALKKGQSPQALAAQLLRACRPRPLRNLNRTRGQPWALEVQQLTRIHELGQLTWFFKFF